MIHTHVEIFFGYMAILWLLENFFMAIFFQLHTRLNTLFNLCLMFFLNVAFIVPAYVVGSCMLFAYSFMPVLLMSVAFVVLMHYLFWLAQGYEHEIGAIVLAQTFSFGCLLGVYLLSRHVF